MPLQPPLDLVYHTLEEAKTAVNAHASAEGYQLCIKRTERVGGRSDGEVKSLVLRCTRSGKVRAVGETVRKRSRSS